MAVYAIGDVQGCYKQFRRLLDKIEFTPGQDQLMLVGDLVNRGKDSLKVLRFVLKHESSIRVVLGNHDLHLLAASESVPSRRRNDTFFDVLDVPDRSDILYWLRNQPIAVHDRKLDVVMVHAGIHPSWTLRESMDYAAEVETALKGSDYRSFLFKLYGNEPNRWKKNRRGVKRLRFFVNVFTRMRFMKHSGELDFNHVGPPGSQDEGMVPWFNYPSRVPISPTIVCGHWSALGIYNENGVLALDTGCCWGRSLCAARIDVPQFEFTTVRCR